MSLSITSSTLCDSLRGQDIGHKELDIVREIERRVSKLTEETLETRRKSNFLSVKKIILRTLALGGNEIMAQYGIFLLGDDTEDELEDWMISQFVPTVQFNVVQVTNKPRAAKQTSLQVIGRALAGAGLMGSEVLKLKAPMLRCNIDNWRSAYNNYLNTFHPVGDRVHSPGSLTYRLSQFLRKVRTELSCLEEDTELASLLASLQTIVTEDITITTRGSGRRNYINKTEVKEAILNSYEAVEFVKLEMEKDWKTTLRLRLVILMLKVVGLGLQTWGQNINNWSSENILTAGASAKPDPGLAGLGVILSLFVLEDVRSLDYSPPHCGSEDLYLVLRRPEFSLILSGDSHLLDRMERRLTILRLSREMKKSLSCLTSLPDQFRDLDITDTKKAVKLLDDRIEDILDILTDA